jgi:hypothetical protein
MRATRLICAAAMLAACIAPDAVAAQDVCGAAETVMGCQRRLVDEATAAVRKADPGAGEEKDLNEKATGPNVSENLAQSAIRDFLPRFAGTLLTSDPTTNLQALDLRFNTPLGAASRSRFALQGGVTLHKAELYGPLADSIPESIREASRKRLEGELEQGDDATAFAAFNLESVRVGRAMVFHQPLVDSLATAVVRAAGIVPEPAALAEFEDAFLLKLGDTLSIEPARRNDPACVDVTRKPVVPVQGTRMEVACLTAEMRAELDRLLAPVARYEANRQIVIASVLSNNGFDRISELVNNQPQLNATAEYRSRVGVIGPNEWTGRARWEMGFVNMNTFRRYCRDRSGNGAAPSDSAMLACLNSYTDSVATRARMSRGDRLWLAGEMRYRPGYELALSEDSVNLSLGSGVGLGASAGYGRYLGSVDEDEDDRDRIDLHVSYDFASGDDLRQSRFLAGAFYTLRISGKASGVVGITWANKPEFVGAADRQLGANFGLTYKFNRDEKKEGGS